MKVLMIDSLIGNDYTLCLCSGLYRTGVDVTLVSTEDRVLNMPVDYPVLRWAPCKVQTVGKIRKLGVYLRYLTRLFIHIRKSKIDAVHFQFFRRERIESFYFALLRLMGTKLIYTAHNMLPHEKSLVDYFLKWIVYKSAHSIIVHSQFIKNKLISNFNINPDKVRVVPHGNFDHYLPEHEMPSASARESLGLSDDDDVLLFFGFIRAYKGVDLLLDAFDLASAKNPRLKLIIAGKPYSTEFDKRYKHRISQIAAKERILYHGHFIPSEMIPTYFAAANAVVLPYKQIDHSGIVHLGYSFGKPLIGTRVGDFVETIEEGKSGFLVEKNNPQQLAGTILLAFTDKNRLAEMGKYNRELSDTKYSWDDIGQKTILLYQLSNSPFAKQYIFDPVR